MTQTEPEIGTGWLTTSEAGPLLCGLKKRSVLNHMKVGTRLPSGKVVRLKFNRLGHYYTRAEWIQQYLEAINPPQPGAAKESPDARQRRFTAEKERLALSLQG